MLAKNAVCVYETMGIASEWEFETKVGKVSATLFDHWVAIRCKDLERAKTIIPHRRIDGDADMNPLTPSPKIALKTGIRMGIRVLSAPAVP